MPVEWYKYFPVLIQYSMRPNSILLAISIFDSLVMMHTIGM